MARKYQVEAWRGIECIGFRTVSRPTTVKTAADHFIADQDADRVYVRSTGDVEGLMADWSATGGWRRIDDPRLNILEA